MSSPAYTYPPAFDVNRARELGKLIDTAYNQLTAAKDHKKQGEWKLSEQLPAGYQVVLEQFTAKEPGGGGFFEAVKDDRENPSHFITNLGQGLGLLAPARLPFGFIVSKAEGKGRVFSVVIRGTITTQEWMADLTANPVPFDPNNPNRGKTTKGFKVLHDDLIGQIRDALEKENSNPETDKVYVTGHSLGAALALLVTATLGTEPKFTLETYTFSGPRTGDPAFADAYAAAKIPTWRIFNTEDLVPTLPLAAVEVDTGQWNVLVALLGKGYQHVGYPVAITFWKPDVRGNHDIKNMCDGLAPQAVQ